MSIDAAPPVYVVDDDAAMRDSLQFLIESGGYVCRTFPSAETFLSHYQAPGAARRGGCLVVDVRMPGMSGLDLQRELNAREATLGLVFISGHGDIPMAVRAIRDGAVEFLEKPFNDQVLLDRIGEAIRRSVEATRLRSRRVEIGERIARLTPRERAVMERVVAGKPNKIIAAELDISPKTVEVHRHNVMEKMQAGSAAELARLVAADPRENP
jgi:FixJ family two-component response regulator